MAKDERRVKQSYNDAIEIPVKDKALFKDGKKRMYALSSVVKYIRENYPHDLLNRFTANMYRGKYSTATFCDIRVIDVDNPMKDFNCSVTLAFKITK